MYFHRYESLQDRVKDVFANSSNPSIIRSVSNIFRVASQETNGFRRSIGPLSTVDENSITSRSHLDALEELGMQGLADTFQFLPPNRGHATTELLPNLVTLMVA
jgi:hypothetical protein